MPSAAKGYCTGSGTNSEPQDIASEAQPEAPAFCSRDSRIALAREGGDFRGVVCGVKLCAG